MGVTAQHKQYVAMADDWQMMEDALSGERAVKDAGTAYLPKTSGMIEAESLASTDASPLSPDEARKLYLAYKDRAQYPLWVKDALRTMIGLVARQEPEIELPSRMASLETNVTADGFGLKQLFLRVVSALLTKGRKPLLVEFDDSGAPYIATYTAETVPNWMTANVGGRQDLTLAVLKESRLKDGTDEFEPEYMDAYRVLDLVEGRYRVRVLDEHGEPLEDEVYPGTQGGSTSKALTFIPLVFAGSTDNSVDTDEIPLLTMAKTALKYYQLSADYYTSMHYTAHPQPVITGIGRDEDLRVTGPMAAWTFENPDADAQYLEFSGQGIEAMHTAMTDQRNAAAEAGAKVLDTGSQESGDARVARQNDQHSSLYSVCVTAAEAIQQALRYSATWQGINEEEVVFKVEPKFTPEEIDAAMLRIVGDMTLAGESPKSVWFEGLRRAGLTEKSDDELALELENPGSND